MKCPPHQKVSYKSILAGTVLQELGLGLLILLSTVLKLQSNLSDGFAHYMNFTAHH